MSGRFAFGIEAVDGAARSGRIVTSRGEVNALSNGGSRELKQGYFIYVSDEIITSNRSFAVLQFEDGAKVTVRPDSSMIIETYIYNGDGNDEAAAPVAKQPVRVQVLARPEAGEGLRAAGPPWEPRIPG